MLITTISRGRTYRFTHPIGRAQSNPPGLNFPTSVVCGKGGITYVLCRSNQSNWNPYISKIKIGEGPGEEEYLATIGELGIGEGQFIWPTYITLDMDENLYLSDEYLQRITVWDREGKFIGMWGVQGDAPGEFNGPSGLAFDNKERLLVVDSLNNRVQRFTKDGAFINQWGSLGSGPGELNMPWGIATDTLGHAYVSDWKNHRIQKFAVDGEFISQFGRPSQGAGDLNHFKSYTKFEPVAHLRRPSKGTGDLNHPADVAIDNDGDVYITDWGNDKVQIYAPDGEYITSLIGDAAILSKWGDQQVTANPDYARARRKAENIIQERRFRMPCGIDICRETDQIVIGDTYRYRIQVYVKDRAYVDPQLTL